MKADGAPVAASGTLGNAASGQRQLGETRRAEAYRARQHKRASGEDDDQRKPAADRCIDRQPPQAVHIRRPIDDRLRLKQDGARQRADRQDCDELHADDKTGADHRGDDLRDEPRAFWTDRAEQPDRQHDRDRHRRHRERQDDTVCGEPMRAAEPGENIDCRRRQAQRHPRDADRHRTDPHREQPPRGSR